MALRDTLLDGRGGRAVPHSRGRSCRTGGGARLISSVLGAVGDGQGGRTLLWAGAAGAGKSALLAWARGEAESRGWRTGHGVAAAIEGAWADATVLEAVADLGRRHPALLDGLDDNYRAEIERAWPARTRTGAARAGTSGSS